MSNMHLYLRVLKSCRFAFLSIYLYLYLPHIPKFGVDIHLPYALQGCFPLSGKMIDHNKGGLNDISSRSGFIVGPSATNAPTLTKPPLCIPFIHCLSPLPQNFFCIIDLLYSIPTLLAPASSLSNTLFTIIFFLCGHTTVVLALKIMIQYLFVLLLLEFIKEMNINET